MTLNSQEWLLQVDITLQSKNKVFFCSYYYYLYSSSSKLRLALERSATAEEAIETIAGLISEYNIEGQSVRQAYVISDGSCIWLMNVVGKLWAAQVITGNI